MVGVVYQDETGTYEIWSGGALLAEKTTAQAAKREGKKQGRKRNERVSYKGPRMHDSRIIWKPSNQDDVDRTGGGGILPF